MPKPRVPSPKDTIKIRRLPTEGATVRLSATVTRVSEGDAGRQGLITLRIPGHPVPISLAESYFLDATDDA